MSNWKNTKNTAPLSIILTFDDGNKSDYNTVFKILKRENITASFFPYISKINTNEGISWTQLKELADNGFSIGSHGVSHQNLLKLSEKECYYELSESKKRIEQMINQNVDSLSFPFGLYNQEILALLKKIGYKTALTTRVKLNTLEDSFLLHRNCCKALEKIRNFYFE